jgi:1,4-alpha-glucan branching enzyme
MDKKFYKETATKEKSFKKTVEPNAKNGMVKKYIKKRQSYKITFTLPEEAVKNGKQVTLVGDFNKWNPDNLPLKKLKNGSFSTTIELLSGRTYRFKYLIDNCLWENDWHADLYLPNPFGGEDSVLTV